MLRLRSAEPPFADTAVAGQAARLLALVEAIGMWQPHGVVETLDGDVFADALKSVAAAGVARHAVFDWEARAGEAPADFVSWIRSVREDVAASPVPDVELPKLDEVLGSERLARSVGVAGSSLRRYLSHDRETPDDVAKRGHVLACIVGDLAGSYNERGVRHWFERPRPQLDGRAPEEILRGTWDADDPEVAKVAALAAERAG